jgi:peptidase E
MRHKNLINTKVEIGRRHIVAIGGALQSPGAAVGASLLLKYIVALSNRRKRKPRVLYIPTATGDDQSSLLFFYQQMAALNCSVQHLSFFKRTPSDLRTLLLSQDVIFVGGGNTKSMLAVWREYGLDVLMKEAWERGVVMSGSSAGGICWFESCLTDSYAGSFTTLRGLGILAGSCCPHYNGQKVAGEETRQASYHAAIQASALVSGYAIDEVTALHFVGSELKEVVSGMPDRAAYEVEKTDGATIERRLNARFLG